MATATTTAPTTDVTSGADTSQGKGVNVGRIAAWAVMVLLILITLFPFYWMVRTAFSNAASRESPDACCSVR